MGKKSVTAFKRALSGPRHFFAIESLLKMIENAF